MNIKGCIDCQNCAKQEKGIPNPCIHDDEMNEIYDAFIKADVVVLASPFTGGP